MLRWLDLTILIWIQGSFDELKRIQERFPELLAAKLFKPKWEVTKLIGDDVAEILETSPFKPQYGAEVNDVVASEEVEQQLQHLEAKGLNPAFVMLIIQIVKMIWDARRDNE